MNILTEEVCALFDARAQERSIRIERAFSPQLSTVCVDQRGIHTVITNLIANAIDACELDKESSSHTITVSTKEQAEGSVEITVEDDGIGMNEEVQKQLFSVFFTTKGSKGTGLGLLVTSKIVQEHGGEISFESAPGVGTTFTIVLPRGQAPQEEANDAEPDLEVESLFA
jgi:signal transduction histidine kinase